MKTLAIRLDDELHTRLVIVAKLAEVSITDAIRQAVETHVQALSASPEIQAKADALHQDIEREAQAQQGALAELFGQSPSATPRPAKRTGRASTDDK